MKNHRTFSYFLLAAVGILFITNTNAAMVASTDGKTINDTDLNITWLADANYAKTSGYSLDGLMTWHQAQSWIAFLNAENGGVGHLGFNNWRLPTTFQPDTSCSWPFLPPLPAGSLPPAGGPQFFGHNCTGSEMGHLFYSELGGVAGSSIASTHNANYGLFSNLQPDYYWSGTEVAPIPTYAWQFDFNSGIQVNSDMDSNRIFALAVHPPKQIVAVPGPAPLTWLAAIALMGLVAFVRKRKLSFRPIRSIDTLK